MQRVLFLLGKAAGERRATAGGLTRAALVFCLATQVAPAVVVANNFTVVGVAGDRATAIIAAAEEVRSAAFASLLGQAEPADWRVRCEIHVHHVAGGFAAAVGGPPAAARGATSIEFGAHDVLLRRIDVMGGGTAIPDALAHEIVHVVLADHFVAEPPPRWADEGLAMLFDAPDIQRQRNADVRDGLAHGLAWSARDLLAIDELPPGTARQRTFYGQSAAVVRWLVARRDAATFIRFLDDCSECGMEDALRAHYDLDSIAVLESAWREPPTITLDGMALAERSFGE